MFCVLLIAARSSGAHLHMCLDRSEPPLSMHVGDIDLHVNDGADVHQDVDLQLVDDGLTKSKNAEIDAPALIAFAMLLCLLPLLSRSTALPPYSSPVVPRFFHSLHAPPRAPPR